MIRLKYYSRNVQKPRRLGVIKDQIILNYKIITTYHSEDRMQSRVVPDNEIIDALDEAKSQIIDNIILGNIKVTSKQHDNREFRFLIIEPVKNGISLVCGAGITDENHPTNIEISVVTAGNYGNEFYNKFDSFVINI